MTFTSTTTATVNTISTTSNSNGTYTINYLLQTADVFTLNIKFGAVDISGSPVTNIIVNVGKVQARYSLLTTSYTPITAGYSNLFRIQAKDIYSNTVVETNERF